MAKQSMPDNQQNNALLRNNRGSIDGISIASFLQMLEQERHTCKVMVSAGNKQGYLFFLDGELIEAEFEQLFGIEAAYAIVSWESPKISLNETEEKHRNIDHPLGFILLNAAKCQDERCSDAVTAKPVVTYISSEAKQNPDFQSAVSILTNTTGIRYFFLLNKTGKIVAHSAPNTALGELIIYCIISSNNLRKSLKAKSPRRIHMKMENGTSLLVIPKSGKILGMLLYANSEASDVANQIHAAFTNK